MLTSNLRKKLTSLILIVSIAILSGCYGSFTLTKKLYNWNGSLGGPAVQTAVMWVMVLIPIYGVAGFVDFIFLNTVEHYTGSNPIAMEEGQSETQTIAVDNRSIKIETKKNVYNFYELEGDIEHYLGKLEYNPEQKSWSVVTPFQSVELARVSNEDPNILELLDPERKTILYSTLSNQVMAKK